MRVKVVIEIKQRGSARSEFEVFVVARIPR